MWYPLAMSGNSLSLIKSDAGITGGAIATIVVLILIVIAAFTACCWRCCQRRGQTYLPVPQNPPMYGNPTVQFE